MNTRRLTQELRPGTSGAGRNSLQIWWNIQACINEINYATYTKTDINNTLNKNSYRCQYSTTVHKNLIDLSYLCSWLKCEITPHSKQYGEGIKGTYT